MKYVGLSFKGVFFKTHCPNKMTTNFSLSGKYELFFFVFSPPVPSGLRPEEINLILENILSGL
jgi:hypothetical protein